MLSLRIFCGCALKPSLASLPARSIIRANPAVVKGVPRSDVTKDRVRARGALFGPSERAVAGLGLELGALLD